VTLRQRIDHELAHLALSRSCPGVALPRWFHEGVAMTLSADAARAEWLSISLAMITHSLLPLHAIDSLNTFNRNKAHLAYCQSHQAVLFLVKNYGMHGIAAIVREARRRGDFWAGMGEVLALTPEEFDRIMHREWAQQYRMAFLFSETLFFWPVVVLVFCIGVVRTIIRNRKRRREFDRQEKENAGTENDADDAG